MTGLQEDREFLMKFGQRLRLARERLGITQGEFAKRMGKAPPLISKYEAGLQAIRITEVPSLARVLDVPVAYLFGETSENIQEAQGDVVLPRILQMCRVLAPPLLDYLHEIVYRCVKVQYDYIRQHRPDVRQPPAFPAVSPLENMALQHVAWAVYPDPKLELGTAARLSGWVDKASQEDLESRQQGYEELDWSPPREWDLDID